jgi:hypothetical protein
MDRSFAALREAQDDHGGMVPQISANSAVEPARHSRIHRGLAII